MRIALLITTFNRPSALDQVLETVVGQTIAPSEVIICDDGSLVETSNLVQSWSSRLRLHHVWQPDVGFRASRVRNLGVAKTRADYLIFVDGDCLLPPTFVYTHRKLACRRHLVAGGRHLLSHLDTEAFFRKEITLENVFNHWKFRHFPMGFMRDLSPHRWESVRSCNFGIFRDEMLAVQGFDEAFVGWGREDSDVIVRLMHNGCKIRSGRLASCVAHLHHPDNTRAWLEANELRFQYSLATSSHTLPESSVLALR